MRKPWRYYRNGWLKRVANMDPMQYCEDRGMPVFTCAFCQGDKGSCNSWNRDTVKHAPDCLWMEIRREMPGAKEARG